MERVIIDESPYSKDFGGDARGAPVDALGHRRIERLALEGMAKNRLGVGVLLKIQIVSDRFDVHANSIAA